MARVKAQAGPWMIRSAGLLAAMSASLMLGACAGGSDLLSTPVASNTGDGAAKDGGGAKTELEKATEYWGKQYAAKPTDKAAALSYAKNLKAMGDKRLALSVLQDASVIHSRDPELMGEFGRLALEFDQYTVAERALSVAEMTDKPDWRVVSAHGTLLAKQGQHKAAIPYFERALQLSPNQTSVMNNLAMANAMSGDAAKAEEILRTVSAKSDAPEKVNQNLALVLGLQGKYDEAKTTGAKASTVDVASANTDYVKRMVRLPAKSSPVAAPSNALASNAPTAKPDLKKTAIDTASAATSTATASAGGWQTNVASNAPAAGATASKK